MENPKVLLTLVGDLEREDAARVKYGLFALALGRQAGRVKPFDVSLRGPVRWLNALQVFHPNPQIWRERFWKNIQAFELRSNHVARRIRDVKPSMVLQIGVVFDSTRHQEVAPVLIYTDYTARLSALRPDAGRSPFSEKDRRLWIEMETDTYHRAAHIFVRSHLVRDSLVFDYRMSPGKISVVGGGVNFTSLPDVQQRMVRPKAASALFIGKEFYRKGGDILLDAYENAQQAEAGLSLRLVTSETFQNRPLPSGVQVSPPVWERADVGALYQAADFFVLPSRLETWGDVLLEAMAYGLPCIGVQSDAMKEIISDGETGILVPPDDPLALADAMLRLTRDNDLRLRLGRAGRKRVETLFTWDKVISRMMDVMRRYLE